MSIKTYIKSICLFLAVLVGAASCTKETSSPAGPVEGGDAAVRIHIYTPSSTVPGSRSAATAGESKVQRIKLLVLGYHNGAYTYRYMVDGEQIMQDENNTDLTTFTAKLVSSDVPLRIFLVANYNDAFISQESYEGLSEAEVKQMMIDSFDYQMAGELPFYGQIDLPQLKADQTNPPVEVTMLRAVARVDVNNHTAESEFSDDFRLESVFIYRANDKISLIPDNSALAGGEKLSVTAATVPAGASPYAPFSKKVALDGDLSILQSYLPESMPVTTDKDAQIQTATCVVVGGYYGNDDTPSYYRIDFDSKKEGHPLGQVLRNHKYIFNITQVNGRGWEDEDKAATMESSAIIATMQVWDELTSEMWFYGNDNYIGISSRDIRLNYFAGDEKTETLQSSVPFTLQPLDANGNLTGSAISMAGQSFTSGFYSLQIEKDSSDGEDVWRLVVTSTGSNHTSDDFTGKFRVTTDWWTFDVDVTQVYYVSDRASRYVRILTITDLYGDLGTTDGTLSDVSGGAMRKVLENKANFSPTGTVEIGGIVVYDLKNATISSSTASDLYILEKVLADVDVVHLGAECTPSAAAAQLIIDWHSANDNRVLIAGMDTEGTNAALRDYFNDLEENDPEDESSGTWLEATVSELMITFEELTHEIFYHGLFGDVQSGVAGGMSRNYPVGYNNGYNEETTLSLVMIGIRNTDNQGKMTHGINQAAGVFYCGDSGITTNGGTAMSADAMQDGTIESNFDILMGNIWSWIIDRVTALPVSAT